MDHYRIRGRMAFVSLTRAQTKDLLQSTSGDYFNILPGGHVLAMALFLLFDILVIVRLGIDGLLFVLGEFILATGAAGSAYGAVSSLIILLLWIYYSAQILLFGAEFTRFTQIPTAVWLNQKSMP